MKKVISLVLSVMMMLTMFAGCKASGTAETVAPTAAPTSAATAETAADTTPAAQEFNVAIVQQLDHASLDEIANARWRGQKVFVESVERSGIVG